MAVSSRKVQNKRDSNGVLTGKAGTVYDVNIKYTGQDGKKKSYAKKGFATKKEATQHEAEMKAKLANPIYSPVVASQGKQTVKEYLEEWVENHGKANLRPSTFAGYKSHIRNYIVPYIGHVQLNQLTPAMLDNMFQQLFDKGLSNSTVRYAQRILSVSMEHARKYRYMLMCGLKENKAYCKPIIKHCNRKQPLQEKKQGKKHRRKRKRKAAKWSYNGNIFL